MHQKRVEAFLKIAAEELEAARRLQAPLPRQAEYFLQQSVEKLLRAVLEIEEIPAGVGHGLASLAHLLPPSHIWRDRFKTFDHLSAASTMYRYPGPGGRLVSVSAEEVMAELKQVEALDREIRLYCADRLSGKGIGR